MIRDWPASKQIAKRGNPGERNFARKKKSLQATSCGLKQRHGRTVPQFKNLKQRVTAQAAHYRGKKVRLGPMLPQSQKNVVLKEGSAVDLRIRTGLVAIIYRGV